MNSQIIKDVAIIIPTKGRQNYLNRIAYYYSSWGLNIYICDAYKTKYDIDKYDNINYSWNPNIGFFEELLDVVKSTNYSYYLLAPDDDFVHYETFMRCYNKLNNNNYLSMGSGGQVFFKEKFDNEFIYHYNMNLINESLVSIVTKNNALFFEKNYQNIHWSLFRRDCLMNALVILDSANFNYACFAEFIFGIEGIRHGGIYFDEGIFNYREDSSKPHWGSIAPSISWSNVIIDKKLRSDIYKLKDIYKDDYPFVKKCLISYMNSSINILNRIRLKISHVRNGYYKIIYDKDMIDRIKCAMSKMN